MPSPHQLEDFFSYLRFPSVSANPEQASACEACAEWLHRKFSGMGFRSTVHQGYGRPVVVARSPFSNQKRTVLVYGHYDVQPADPLELWSTPPFEPTIRDGLVIARGATDNKGQTMCHILGAEETLREEGELPVNLIFLIEGEEEIGSPHLRAFLEEHRADLACDAVVISDTSMIGPGFPAMTCGLRGIACLEVKVSGPATDLHSGMFGGAVVNPAAELARLLARLHREDGSIAVPGFYDDVAPVAEAERATWADLPPGDEAIIRMTGVPRPGGEQGYTAWERLWIRPTAEINGLTAGYQGPWSKTVPPREAIAKLSFRLVPDQNPEKIAEQVRAYFKSISADTVRTEVVYDHGGNPYYASPESLAGRAAQAALAEVFGRPPALVREGLSIPVVALFSGILKRDPLLVGFGLPDCNAHAPDESFPLEQLELGIALHRNLVRRLASMGAAA
jgi:acetylornithine deacetylase/succinyl-diaminopimelate desuccinylase-like protein